MSMRSELVLVPYGVSIFLFIMEELVTVLSVKFSSPMGYLYFYSPSISSYSKKFIVLVPYGVSIFLFGIRTMRSELQEMVLVPYGVSIFLFGNRCNDTNATT